jgi:hypothetical protein
MLRSIKELHGYTVRATDGDIGTVHEFYFDDHTWTIRYLVVDTGGWLSGRPVLLSTLALGQPDWEERVFPVLLTREQVEHSPDIATHKPVSRQMEGDLHAYYGWSPYWRTSMSTLGAGAAAVAHVISGTEEGSGEPGRDPHLRSTRQVSGYHIQASDGEIGHVEDFIAEDEAWVVRYIVVDTRNWLPGRKVLVAPAWIERVSWAERKVHVDLTRETIKHSPEFDPSAPVNREYELRLYDYYGRPKYWTKL